MAVMTICHPVHASYEDVFTIDNFYYRIISETEHSVSVVGITKNPFGDLVIPTDVIINGSRYFVTEIGDGAFDGCNMTSVVIPNSVTTIGFLAFQGCDRISSVEIPASVTSISGGSFPYCASLTNILVDAGNKNYVSYDGVLYTKDMQTLHTCPAGKRGMFTIPESVTEIAYASFVGCDKVTYVNIPNSVTKIGISAFYWCSSLTSVKIPNSVKSIGNQAFVMCSSLTSVEIPNSVTEIGESAFGYCTALTSVIIPNSITAISAFTFSYCSSLASVIIPNSVTTIGESAFDGCHSLTSATLPNSVKTIGHSAFSNCRSLISVVIPNSVTSIPTYAFHGCSGLPSVTIPSSVSTIGTSAFSDCTSLTEIIVDAGNKNFVSSNGVLYTKDMRFLHTFPGGKGGTFTIPSSVTNICRSAFCGCRSLTSVEIPTSITELPTSTFDNCSELLSVAIPTSVTKIGEAAFQNCNRLSSIEIPNSVTEIGEYAFNACSSLTSVVIPSSVTDIGDRTFGWCHSLTSVVIPSSVTTIGTWVFYDCTSLKTIYSLAEVPPTIGIESFSGVPTDANIYVPNGTSSTYSNADGWDYFDQFIEVGTIDITLSAQNLNLEIGESKKLAAFVVKSDDMTIETKTWTTSNSKVAIVDNGVVTAVGEGMATVTFTVFDSYGCPHSEYCEVIVIDPAGIEDIKADEDDATAEFYTIGGVAVSGENLTPGLYIKRQNGKASKFIVK